MYSEIEERGREVSESMTEYSRLAEEGFVRRRCPSCGRYFWTLDPDRVNCGDPPCEDYLIVDNPVLKKMDLPKARAAFLDHLKDLDHEIIDPYPIVARWRDDLSLVNASIACFQPRVVEGLEDPPANPLAIAQPCVRFSDIDNVGRSGRHLSFFEMLGQHAFNVGKRIYWIDECLEISLEFLRKLGANLENATFVEDFWEGGGYGGNCLEVTIGGLEIGTLVFMDRKLYEDGTEEKLNGTVIDVGYGLERIVWASRGDPTVYDAIMRDIIERLFSITGLNIDTYTFRHIAPKLGVIDVRRFEDLEGKYREISNRVGIDIEDLKRILRPLEIIYSLADHSRTLLMMLAQGVIPSNIREGYLARLLIRRLARYLSELEVSIDVQDLIQVQYERWRRFYQFLDETDLEKVMEIIDLELSKYYRSLRVGSKVLSSLADDIKKKFGGEVPPSLLYDLYKTYGLAPELLREMAQPLGIRIRVPPDFYARIGMEFEKIRKKKPTRDSLEEKLRSQGIPPTDVKYLNLPYNTEFFASVLRTLEDWIILDQTYFYPGGGGQPHDIGEIEFDGKKARIVEVRRAGPYVAHRVSGEIPREGSFIKCVIDRRRRLALMRYQTASHILIEACRRILGDHVWQMGLKLDEGGSKLDISHYKPLDSKELEEIEKLANEIVLENRIIRSFEMERGKAFRKYGVKLYLGGIPPEDQRIIRIVEIPNWNIQACGGTHCSSTGEVGLIKIVRAEHVQDGVERIEFLAGEDSLRYLREKEYKLRKLSEIVGSPEEGVERRVGRVLDENRSLRRLVSKLAGELARYKASEIYERSERIDGLRLAIIELEYIDELLESLAERLSANYPDLISIIVSRSERGSRLIVATGVDTGISASSLASSIARELGGGAGGNDRIAIGGIHDIEDLESLRKIALSKISSLRG